MTSEKAVRRPKQARSIGMKEKILHTAYRLFCEKGYYKTTTNEIARQAGVSIGSLYSYYQDKDSIFLEILERYHNEFIEANNRLKTLVGSYRQDQKTWLREMIESLVELHEIGKDLNREIKLLCETNPKVAAIEEQHMAESRRIAYECIELVKNDIRYDDVEAASVVIFDMTSAVVDEVVFGAQSIPRDRIIQAGVEILYSFLKSSEAR